MAISPPNYQKDAIPTARGWTHPRTGELLKAQKLSPQQIDEYNGVAEIPIVQTITESPVTEQEFAEEHLELDMDNLSTEETEEEYWMEDDLDGMSKKELEELGREYGIELDRRLNKDILIEQLKAVMFED